MKRNNSTHTQTDTNKTNATERASSSVKNEVQKREKKKKEKAQSNTGENKRDEMTNARQGHRRKTKFNVKKRTQTKVGNHCK